MWIVGALVVCLVLGFLVVRGRNRAANRVVAPSVLILDLSDGLDAAHIRDDRAVYGREFSSVKVSDRPDAVEAGPFDVVHVFAHADGDGRVAGLTLSGFMALLASARPKLVVMASENPGSFLHGIRLPQAPPFSLIATSDRRGDRFPAFLGKLFHSMFAGRVLALAWSVLSPQTDGPGRDDEPVALCIPIFPGLSFAPARWR